ncbi:MAG TPA: hypothetical protein VMF13_11775 [Luteitalea sp.]|nr:hypothetical protein [Luteitalea sp.]
MMLRTRLSPRVWLLASGLLTTFAWAAAPLATTTDVSARAVQGQAASAAPADRMQQKLESIVKFGAIPRLETQSTVIEEGEVNAYLASYLQSEIPPGISNPTLRIVGDGRLAGSATLDLDALNASRPAADGFDPIRMLRGSLAAKVSGRLITENGTGRFELESAELGGIPLPRAIVSQMVTRFSTSPEQPEGIDINAPFDLPSAIREIRVEPGQVTVLQ